MSGKHEAHEKSRRREIIEEIPVATSAGLLVKVIELLARWLINKQPTSRGGKLPTL